MMRRQATQLNFDSGRVAQADKEDGILRNKMFKEVSDLFMDATGNYSGTDSCQCAIIRFMTDDSTLTSALCYSAVNFPLMLLTMQLATV